MGIIVFAVFVLVWLLPLFIKQRKTGLVAGNSMLLGILSGLLPAAILLILSQIVAGWIFAFIGLNESGMLRAFISSFIMAALIEELFKFYFANKILQKAGPYKKIDCFAVFGAVGLGYEIIESAMFGLSDPLTGIIRGFSLAHVMYQFIMASHYFEWKKAERDGNEGKAKFQKCLLFSYPSCFTV